MPRSLVGLVVTGVAGAAGAAGAMALVGLAVSLLGGGAAAFDWNVVALAGISAALFAPLFCRRRGPTTEEGRPRDRAWSPETPPTGSSATSSD